MSRLLAGDPAAEAATPEPAGEAPALTAEGIDDPELISAIVAAVHRFRNERS